MRILKSLLALICLTTVRFAAYALGQQEVDFTSEHVLLLTDKQVYSENDTVWFTGLVTCATEPDGNPLSRYLYVELIDPDSKKVLQRSKFACGEDGGFKGWLPLNVSPQKDAWVIRAYTNLMRNFSTKAFSWNVLTTEQKENERIPSVSDSKDNASRCQVDLALYGTRLEIEVGGDVPEQRRFFLFRDSEGLSELTTPKNSGKITLSSIPTEPITFFVTDKDLKIIGERTILPDSDQITAEAWENLCSLWSSDFDCHLPFPSGTSGIEAKELLEKWFDNARFCRFSLKQCLETDTPKRNFSPEKSLTVSGKVFIDPDERHPLKEGKIIAMNRASGETAECKSDKSGTFTLTLEDFADGTGFYLGARDKREKTVPVFYRLTPTTYPAVDDIPAKVKSRLSDGGDIHPVIYADDGVFLNLPDLVVRAKTAVQDRTADKKHYAVRYLDEDTFGQKGCFTVLDALRKLAFVRVVKVGKFEDDVPSGGGGSLLGRPESSSHDPHRTDSSNSASETWYTLQSTKGPGFVQLPIIFDGIKITEDEIKENQHILDLPTSQIESIEHLSMAESLPYASYCIEGAVMIRTKKPGQHGKPTPKGFLCWPVGLGLLSDDETADNNAL